jgi:hypothetical protein
MASLLGMTIDSLALGVCAIWAVAMALMDLQSYRISNRSLLFGLFVIWPCLYLIGQGFQLTVSVLVFSLVIFLVGLASLIGMGDVKLLLFLGPWLNYDNIRIPLILLIVLSWLQLSAELVRQRSFPQQIAFAPAILVAAALNMAT